MTSETHANMTNALVSLHPFGGVTCVLLTLHRPLCSDLRVPKPLRVWHRAPNVSLCEQQPGSQDVLPILQQGSRLTL